jgi:hypothetical protein
MALKSWLVSLKADVSNVSGVQTPINAGVGRYVTESTGVSGVSGLDGMVASDTADTAGNMQASQAQSPWALACTGDTADTCVKINADLQSTDEAPAPTQAEPKRLFRQSGPWLKGAEQSAAKAYHAHHFNCHTCIAAGRGIRYDRRCAVGLAMWLTYTEADEQ